MGKMVDMLLGRDSSGKIIYDAAMYAMDKLSQKIKVNTEKGEEDFSIDSHVWSEIIPGDQCSPKIMGLEGNKSLIYYPKNSTPYSHHLVDKCKFATILSGCIYDELSGRKFSAEQIQDGHPYSIKIKPTDNFRPHTKNCECYVLVEIEDCDKSLSQIC